MLTTTLNNIRAHYPCKDGWTKLLRGLSKSVADDEPLAYAKILKINGPDDALWCLRAEPKYSREWRLMAVQFARARQNHISDNRSIAAIDIAEKFANGQATAEELCEANAAANDAANAAADAAAYEAARAAAYAAYVAGGAYNATYAAAYAATYAAYAAGHIKSQEETFLNIVGREE